MSTTTAEPTTGRTPRMRAPTAPLWATGWLAGVLVAATLYGLLFGGAYRPNPARADLDAILRGQDLLTLLAVPVLVWSAVRARAGSLRAHLCGSGSACTLPTRT